MPLIHLGDVAFAALGAFALNLLVALVILILGWTAAGWVQHLLRRALAQVGRLDATLRLLLASLTRYAVLAFALLAALAQLGIQTASLRPWSVPRGSPLAWRCRARSPTSPPA